MNRKKESVCIRWVIANRTENSNWTQLSSLKRNLKKRRQRGFWGFCGAKRACEKYKTGQYSYKGLWQTWKQRHQFMNLWNTQTPCSSHVALRLGENYLALTESSRFLHWWVLLTFTHSSCWRPWGYIQLLQRHPKNRQQQLSKNQWFIAIKFVRHSDWPNQLQVRMSVGSAHQITEH